MSKIKNGITQITASTEGVISAEGKIGKNKASGSIDSEGIWDLGIDFKVGGLGITNDYGGAITISIAGQTITWGREGGRIHYNLGGFEVIVEARDCIVTETKLIMGIEVASHMYPDPGCKLPNPNEEPKLPEPFIQPFNEQGIALPETGAGWVFYRYKYLDGSPTFYDGIYYTTDDSYASRSINYDETFDASFLLPFAVEIANTKQGYITRNLPRTTTSVVPKIIKDFRRVVSVTHNGRTATIVDLSNTVNNNGVEYQGGPLYIFRGELADIKEFIELANAKEEAKRLTDPRSDTYRIIPLEFIPFKARQKKPQPFLQPGVPPQVKNDCCEEILESLDDLKDVLHVDFFKKEKFPVPSYLLAPGVDTSKTTVANNYYNLFQKLFQALAHSTIVSPKIDIKDADAVKPGDQPINSEYLSATGWAEAITKMLYEIVDDGKVGTNMDIRTGVTVTQVLVAFADLSHRVDCIIDFIGIPTKRTKDEVETSYSLVVEGESSKGFDPKKANQKLDLNADISTEKLLSSLLRTRKNPIVKEEIHPKAPTLFELLQDLKNKE
jgi:hypothetical protein